MRKSLDFDRVGEVLREAADTLVCPRFRRLDDTAISTKSHQDDLVTIADLEAEVFLTRELTALLPDSRALGEEAVYQDPSAKAILDTDAPVWIIDPVDGTANFARGSTAFGIIVALVHERRTVAGWIYDPLQRRLFTTETGAGAWSDGQRLTVSPRGTRGLDGLSGCISRRMAERHRERFCTITQQGSAAHDYMALVDRRLDFRLFRLLNPWDHAAGVLMVEEAGGYVRLLSGPAYTPEFHANDGLLIAPDAETWDEIRATLDI